MGRFKPSTVLRGVLRDPFSVPRHLMYGDASVIPIKQLAKFVNSPSPVVVEAGIFDGRDTLKLFNYWPEATIYGFEPHPTMFDIAQRNLSNRKNVHLHQVALVEDEHTESIALISGTDALGQPHSSSSILEPAMHLDVFPDVRFEMISIVRATTLDKFFRESGVESVDLMWLDLQGAELQVLRGARDYLDVVDCIYLEISDKPMYAGACTFAELHEFLSGSGFSLRKFRMPFYFGNAIYCKC